MANKKKKKRPGKAVKRVPKDSTDIQKHKEVQIAATTAVAARKRVFIFKLFDGIFPNQPHPRRIAANKLMDKLKAFGYMSLDQLGQQGSHSLPVTNITKAAQKRLKAIPDVAYYDQIFSFRLGGQGRLFACTSDRYELVIWLDEDHQICPSHKKNN